MKGYKAFNDDMTCRDKQYKVGETYQEDGELKICKHGIHFCERLIDVFRFYQPYPCGTKVCEVEVFGDVITDGFKSCTNKLKIVRELSWEEITNICNLGNYNSGLANVGEFNSGNCNAGSKNVGDANHGFANTGDYNVGDFNSGTFNIGQHNSGMCNLGSLNTGNWNAGNRNTGDWNISNCNNGCFNTIEPKITLFNKPSQLTFREWRHSEAQIILNSCPNPVTWVPDEEMTPEEKEDHPEFKTTCGYLKETAKDTRQIWWDNLSDNDKQVIISIPNFDVDIFYQCTGIRIKDVEKYKAGSTSFVLYYFTDEFERGD